MSNQILLNKHMLLTSLITLISAVFSLNLAAQQQSQTLILLGSEPKMCAGGSSNSCEQVKNTIRNIYSLTVNKIEQVAQHWPTSNLNNKKATLEVLSQLYKNGTEHVSKQNLLWQWRDVNNEQLQRLSVHEYNYVFDMLEVSEGKNDNKINSKAIKTPRYKNNDILQFITGSLKVNSAKPTMLVITAARRDPYAYAELATSFLAESEISAKWLALTPALAKAITTGRCAQLPLLRNSTMQVYNRESMYPSQTQTEYSLCKSGVVALTTLIKNSTGVMYHSGDAALLHSVLFNDENDPYPWTNSLITSPVIVGIGEGSAIQGNSLITNENATITNVLKGETLTTKKGLATFNYGVLSTHFSEQNNTFKLAMMIDTLSNSKATSQYGFGVDENTALVAIKSPEGNLMTVVGENGVVYLTPETTKIAVHIPEQNTNSKLQEYRYSYWPAGSVIDVSNNSFTLSERTLGKKLPSIKIPPLPVQRFGSILTDAKLRSLTQAMCLAQEQSAVAQQDEFLISLNANADTRYDRISTKQFGCAVSNLLLVVESF
ncbi:MULTISPECIES: hypothetical protein [unclassified Pseudoalteromonas]|uniref:hypothetical protein n=1 Tax=unclassified Pseudoalteromonas TaxID=194690 RepID=UPI0007319437|nr:MULTISPECIES: hypothetical protein [unclassified Pseudoalteromonas]KTD96023.1 cyanophycinase [Pseudoalteromonas sp. H71]TMN78597.1 cyanophycinase [Pseudoalteromonas sp. S410]TMN88206.1 cyanophycinase [Pseudoalteromonas sp. S408]TMN96608.1 cyanophycinase [Pseudoalteromonas sp. S407]TMO01492.1 cyanophycinase [Pseudoalteromonas sp. S409]